MQARTVSPSASSSPARSAPRYDIYVNIHKALRLAMSDTLGTLGRMDPADSSDVARVVAQVRELLLLCRLHLEKEERFVHPALEARVPGSSRAAADDHDEHLQAFERLEREIAAVESSTGAARRLAGLELYRYLALFVAENFIHMHAEEIDNNAALWASYTDDELRAIEASIVAAVPRDVMPKMLRWMGPALDPSARAHLFGGIRSSLPPAAFAGVVAIAAPHLTDVERRKLEDALAA